MILLIGLDYMLHVIYYSIDLFNSLFLVSFTLYTYLYCLHSSPRYVGIERNEEKQKLKTSFSKPRSNSPSIANSAL